MYSEVTSYLQSPIGALKLTFKADKLLALSVLEVVPIEDKSLFSPSSEQQSNNILLLLTRYFSSAASFPNISLFAKGTAFQQAVWLELIKIPLGETRTYGEIAKKIKSGARAVGNACRKNPIQIIIPCHRVVSAQGMGGYSGETVGAQLDIKHWLLKHEGVVF